MKNVFFRKLTVFLLLFAVTISFSGCFLFGGEEEELPDWRVNPTAIVNAELALEQVRWYFELMEFEEDAFYVEESAEELTAVTENGSRLSGFAVFLTQPLWSEDISFFFVARDGRLFYNLAGEQVRAGVPLIIPFETEALTLEVYSHDTF
ncbi:MAG: hypothetical protein FWD48_10205 [Oscillospiraceae bacterium]|nr:hypothetical protein [Oscillospiraceae bacterium]